MIARATLASWHFLTASAGTTTTARRSICKICLKVAEAAKVRNTFGRTNCEGSHRQCLLKYHPASLAILTDWEGVRRKVEAVREVNSNFLSPMQLDGCLTCVNLIMMTALVVLMVATCYYLHSPQNCALSHFNFHVFLQPSTTDEL